MYDDNEATEFDPSPWGNRQRVLPRRTFKPVASRISQAPKAPEAVIVQPLAPAPVIAQAPSLVAHVARSAVPANVSTFGTPLVREADIPTWRVPKLAPPAQRRKRLDLQLWVPIGGLVSIVIIALLATGKGGELRADAASISAAAPLGETSDNRFHIVANVEDPPAAPAPLAIEPPAPSHHPIAVAKARHAAAARTSHESKRPLLAVDVATPLGDLAHKRRR